VSDILQRLEKWYLDQCNDEWEHRYGVQIGTLDNPGWEVKIELTGTPFESVPFSPIAENVHRSQERPMNESYYCWPWAPDWVKSLEPNPAYGDWLICKVEDKVYIGAGNRLEPLLHSFLQWVGY